MSSRPSIVLVHGAWHSPAHWTMVTEPLIKQGYEVVAPQLPSVGAAKDSGNGLHQDATAVAHAIRSLKDAGKDVVLIMHSYAGVAGSEGAAMVCEEQKAAGKSQGRGEIVKLVYIAAYVIFKDMSVAGEHTPDKDPRPVPVTFSEEGLMTHNETRERFYELLSSEQAKAAQAELKPMAASTFFTDTKYCGWSEYSLPVFYLGCKKDQSIPLAMQEDFVSRIRDAGAAVTAEWWDCSHSPFAADPEAVVEYINRVVSHA